MENIQLKSLLINMIDDYCNDLADASYMCKGSSQYYTNKIDDLRRLQGEIKNND